MPLSSLGPWWRTWPRWAHLLVLTTWTAAISIATLLPSSALPASDWLGFDKLAHVVGWGGVGMLAFPVFRRPPASLLAASLHGALIEILQRYIPGRSSELLDWVADVMGAALGVSLAQWLWKRDPDAP